MYFGRYCDLAADPINVDVFIRVGEEEGRENMLNKSRQCFYEYEAEDMEPYIPAWGSILGARVAKRKHVYFTANETLTRSLQFTQNQPTLFTVYEFSICTIQNFEEKNNKHNMLL